MVIHIWDPDHQPKLIISSFFSMPTIHNMLKYPIYRHVTYTVRPHGITSYFDNGSNCVIKTTEIITSYSHQRHEAVY